MPNNKFKLSKPSIVLITLAFLAFILAKIYIPTPEDYDKLYAQNNEDKIEKSHAKALGLTVDEFKTKQSRRGEVNKLIGVLNNAIKRKDKIQFLNALSELSLSELNHRGGSLLSNAIKANNLVALKLLTKKGISCDSNDHSGKQAFEMAIRAETSSHIRYLQENCVYSEDKTIEERVVQSLYPSKLFEMDAKYKTQAYRTDLFITTLGLGHIEAARRILKKGIDPKARKDGSSVLHYSLLFRQTEIAEELIKQGADITEVNSGGMSILTASLFTNQLKISRYILDTVPDYFEKIQKESNVLRSLFHFIKDDPALDLKALNLLIEYGIDSKKFIDKGAHLWMRKAITLHNVDLIIKLLEMGVDSNKPDRLYELLRLAKRQKGNRTNKVVEILQKYGAKEITKPPKKLETINTFEIPKIYNKHHLVFIQNKWKMSERYYEHVISGEKTEAFYKINKDSKDPMKTIVYDFKKENILSLKFEDFKEQKQWSLTKENTLLRINDSTYEIVNISDQLIKFRTKTKMYGLEFFNVIELTPEVEENLDKK